MDENTIFNDLKSEMPEQYEKDTPGFLTYDLLKASAIEINKLYAVAAAVEAKLNVANLTGEELTNECYYRRGIVRKAATFAKVSLTLAGNGTVKVGDLFSTNNGIDFASTVTKSISVAGTINAVCVTPGIIGNVGAGSIVQIPVTLPGISSVTNTLASYDGFDEETDESLLERYLDDVRKPITSNNIYHFEKWAREIAGVGKAKIFPTWNGNNSVKVAIINDNMLPASNDLVATVQAYIDPIDPLKWGKGYGQAALGSYCTVVSGTAKVCSITANVVKYNSYTVEQIEQSIIEAVTNYFKDIAFDETIDYVSYAKLAALIVAVDGVVDIKTFYLNGSTNNIALAANEVPVLGSVNVT